MTPEQLNKRIQATADLRSIITTMKMLSSVSVTQFTQAETGLRAYTKTLREGFQALAAHNALKQLKESLPEKESTLLLLIGSDNGLVGVFNKSVLLQAKTYMQKNKLNIETTPCICLGKRLCVMAKYEKFHVIDSFPIPNNISEIANNASALLHLIQKTITVQKMKRVVVFHNEKEKESAHVQIQQIIPFQLPQTVLKNGKKWNGRSFPMFSISTENFFHALIHEYIVTILAQTIISSLVSEHFTRMLHMQQAEKNIDETLEEMNLIYAGERQTMITNELIDIISGANSIKKRKKTLFNS